MEIEKVYVVTLWSGGRPGKRWKTLKEPQLLSNGTGISFISLDTKLSVKLIGSISVEEFEQGLDESIYLEDTPRLGQNPKAL